MKNPILLAAAALSFSVHAEKAYLFSYFSNFGHGGRSGESAGLHLAYSYDGLKWTALNGDRPLLVPQIGKDRLMRDPSICQGPDGTFHMVWTSSWHDRIIGYASSKDLVNWSAQRAIPVMAGESEARNAWAPEVTYCAEEDLFYIYWATTIPGRHSPIPGMDKKENGLNHRIYLTTTRDFNVFSPTRLWFDPGFSAIDAAIVRDEKNGDWIMAVKNENHTPAEKNIRITRTKRLKDGFPAEVSDPITQNWVEGPSPLFVGDTLYVYVDFYRNHRYGAVRSFDRGRTWEEVPQGEMSFPAGMRHGTAFAVDREIVDRLAGKTPAFRGWAGAPPMGWNSWDCYGPLVDEAAYKANADFQAEHLLKHGYEYCVVDIRWTVQNERGADYNQKDPVYTLDGYGRYIPDPNRFPSSEDSRLKYGRGFKPLADYVHSKGLKFGIHIMRGVPKEAAARRLPVKGMEGVTCADIVKGPGPECAWLKDNLTADPAKKGAQEYYDSMMELYASWGVDFIKCDDLSAPIYRKDEVEMLRKAIDRCGRKIVLSTSPGETPLSEAEHVAANANMWRMVNDLWDDWRAVDHLTDVTARWLQKPHADGAWPDCDMLPLGTLCVKGYGGMRKCRLSADEQRYLMALMCFARSPLMIGSDLPSLKDDPGTMALLTDPLLLAVNRTGRNARVVRHTGDILEIHVDMPDGFTATAVFDRRAHKVDVAIGI
ncbi:MAG: family 43 glycosylhydrolase [Kiritimatiellae bacterium]|nr:family 43 glycosylhydrolase [Kiritimatiellia bacterium]